MEDEKELVTTEQFKERDKKLLQDIFQVKTPKLEADEKGRVRLSMKALTAEEGGVAPAAPAESQS